MQPFLPGDSLLILSSHGPVVQTSITTQLSDGLFCSLGSHDLHAPQDCKLLKDKNHILFCFGILQHQAFLAADTQARFTELN